jgi:sugar/nucleoside kinase (ribokinase family)
VDKKKIIISGTGCALADYLYTGIDFNGPEFGRYRSRQPGDGGLSPGKLVFTEEIEKYAGVPYPDILREITGDRKPDAFNIGGPGLVSMIHASQLLGREAFDVRFYGITGRDRTADLIFDLARKTPLDISNYRPVSGRDTPCTDVLSDPAYHDNQGERTFINHIGAAWDYRPELLPVEFFLSDIVCFGGTALLPVLHDNLGSLLEKAKDHNCLTLVNTVFDFRNEKKNPDRPWPLGEGEGSFRLIDLLIMDREESVRISGRPSLEKAAAFFMESGVASFIITNGADDAFAFSGGTVFHETGLRKVPVSGRVAREFQLDPGLRGDTTGCGDNFTGGAVASLARQMKTGTAGEFDFDDTLAWAMASGGFACFYLGGTYIEKNPGEKYERVLAFKDDYLRQLTLRKT